MPRTAASALLGVYMQSDWTCFELSQPPESSSLSSGTKLIHLFSIYFNLRKYTAQNLYFFVSTLRNKGGSQ